MGRGVVPLSLWWGGRECNRVNHVFQTKSFLYLNSSLNQKPRDVVPPPQGPGRRELESFTPARTQDSCGETAAI